jgi:hypothetical protein
MALPNLSGLSLATDAKLFEYVATRGGGKKSCVRHIEPVETKEDENANVNCAIDGYLMYKAVPGKEGGNPQYSGKYLEVVVDGAVMTLSPLLKRGRAAADRTAEFLRLEFEWIRDTFPLVCARGQPGSDLGTITWDDYGEELGKVTEWYFLDPQKRGHIFIQLLDTSQYKIKNQMPLGGVFAGRYLYIALVCAQGTRGYGSELLKLAEAVSRKLDCDGISLASLSNSAGFYYSRGYKFVGKQDGEPLDVTAWVEIAPDGKEMLRPEKDVNPYGQPTRMQRDKRGRDADQKTQEALEQERGQLRNMFDEAVARARSLYSRLTWLSM